MSDAFLDASFLATPGVDPTEVVDRLAERWETSAPTIPTEVDNLRQLGRLQRRFAALVGLIGVLGLANALVVLVRRRRATSPCCARSASPADRARWRSS